MPWQKLANDLMTDPALKALTVEQVKAVIDVLILTIQADKKVSFMEEAELEHMLAELPWFKDKEARLETYIKEVTERISTIEDEAGFREVAQSAASKLSEQDAREKVYHMAVALAGADMEIHPTESQMLTWLAESFEIPETKRAILDGAP